MMDKEFQKKLLLLLLNDINFYLIMKKFFKASYFSYPQLSELFKLRNKYNEKYENKFDFETFIYFVKKEIELNNNYNDEIIEEINKYFEFANNFMKENNWIKKLDVIKNEALEYYEHMYLKEILMQSINYYKANKKEKVKQLFENYLSLPKVTDLSVRNLMDVDNSLLSREIGYSIPYKKINNIMNGGLPAKNVGVIVGTSGSGKSWILIDLFNHYIKMGYNVLYISLELDERYITKRILANFFKKNIFSVSDENVKEYYEKFVTLLKENNYGIPFIIEKSPNSIDVNDIKVMLDNIRAIYGKQIDVILIDYADLMLPKNINYRESEWKKIGDIYKDIIGLAKDLNIPIWTVSQSNRSGYKAKDIENDNMAGSMQKVYDASFILSFKILDDGKEPYINSPNHYYYKIKMKVNKNRMGFTGITYYGVADFSIGKIALFDTKEEMENSISTGLTKEKFIKLLNDTYINTNKNYKKELYFETNNDNINTDENNNVGNDSEEFSLSDNNFENLNLSYDNDSDIDEFVNDEELPF